MDRQVWSWQRNCLSAESAKVCDWTELAAPQRCDVAMLAGIFWLRLIKSIEQPDRTSVSNFMFVIVKDIICYIISPFGTKVFSEDDQFFLSEPSQSNAAELLQYTPPTKSTSQNTQKHPNAKHMWVCQRPIYSDWNGFDLEDLSIWQVFLLPVDLPLWRWSKCVVNRQGS